MLLKEDVKFNQALNLSKIFLKKGATIKKKRKMLLNVMLQWRFTNFNLVFGDFKYTCYFFFISKYKEVRVLARKPFRRFIIRK